ncbi:zinc-binding dehydrogenase [Dactylosporangium sp. NPDC049525]|uniref:zinc-binding dehydrogenase n=1 Tax=Dactylosporangium sp. NPDC049525 TaxID=3154730 RepID=UPI00344A2DB3
MRAVVCHEGTLGVADVPDRRPDPGQVLLDVVACGICGSDLHARQHADVQADALAEVGYHGAMRSTQRVVLGHEFCGTVAEYGPGCRRSVPTGTTVVALPLLRTGNGLDAIGISAAAPGAYAEQVVVQESLMLAVPNGLPAATAALTEPMAIGWHAVRRAEVSKGDVAIVIGCGPVGLAVVSMLKARGVRTVVAGDPSPARRALARACGADVVVDPAGASPYTAAGDRGHVPTVPAAVELGVGTVERLRGLPVPWQHVWRAADALGIRPKRPVVFECVGVPGILDQVIAGVPLYSRIVVVSVCMVPDTIRPVMAVNKELDLRFVVGYTPLEFRDTLHLIAGGKVRPGPLITGTVGLDGVPAAFGTLARPDTHVKILIDPGRAGAEL